MKNTIKMILLGLNIALYITTIIMWISIPEYLTLNISTTVFTIGLTVLLLYLDREKVRVFASSSMFENIMSNGIRVFLVFCFLCLGNYLITKFPQQWDVTDNKMNSLSDETRKVVGQVDGNLDFYVFANADQRKRILPLLELYQFINSEINVRAIDPETNPSLVREFGIKETGEIGAKYRDKTIVIKNYDEISITKGLLKLIREKDPKILFTKGHGELVYNNNKPGSISKLYSYLRHSHFQIESKSIMQLDSLSNYTAIFILGPQKEFLENETAALKSYVESGGRLFIALDPDFNFKGKKNLQKLAEGWGISINSDVVLDMNSKVKGSKGLVPIVSNFNKKHPLTRDFAGTIFLPITSSVSVKENFNPKAKLSNLFFSSDYPSSWAKSNFDEIVNGNYSFTEGNKGPIPLAASLIQNFVKDKASKVLAFGNSKFITDMYFGHGDNINFFLNMVSWLVEEEFAISSSRAAINKKPAFINPAQLNIIFFFSVIFAPLICFGLSFACYRRRRSW